MQRFALHPSLFWIRGYNCKYSQVQRIAMTPCQTLLHSLRQNGLRITPQREMIVQAIAHSHRHLTAEQIYQQVQAHTHTVNLATVYRTLDLLVEQGLIHRLHLGSGQIVYTSQSHGPHVHLVCRQCGQVTDADSGLISGLSQQIQADYAFHADLQHISITGLCAGCQAS